MNRMRVSDAERDQVAEILREAAAEGRITLEELDERLDGTYAAKTYADLEPLTADLPGWSVAGTASAAQASVVRPDPVSTPRPANGGVLVLDAMGGTIKRNGRWQVPPRVEVTNKYGSTKLDFREAALVTPVVEVFVDASWGEADLLLPENATADIDVDSSWFGSLKVDVSTLRGPGAPHFVITGTCQGGGFKVRYRRAAFWDMFDA
ncbi:hypothetical protein ADL05_01530 [Nocardiopsis sp. NRRL B-16309]|nr:hypothetical protein ADL05_01530 [Nocardiopsis sp. NRRL B-16309]